VEAATVEIVPGKSINGVRLGMRAKDLPTHAREVDGIQFLLDDSQTVVDVWIDDIRTFPRELRYQDKVIPKHATIEFLGSMWGRCERITGIKGGIFYNCAAGVAVGTDFSRSTLQIRVKPIATGDE
jgi:hypothetical protein